ncbi:murein biosynthesis integral membrane protein MurJ, partial [Enterococcus hirae]
FVSYVAPVLWNGAIVGLLTGAAITGATGVGLAEALAWGTLLGGALQLLVQLAAIRRTAADGLRAASRSAFSDVRTVAGRALP